MTGLPPLGQQAAGLVVMLDAAGRTIAQLEERVERLTAAVSAEREARLRAERLLADLRSAADASDVPQQTPDPTDNDGHDPDASSGPQVA